jgi:hypothetical protein
MERFQTNPIEASTTTVIFKPLQNLFVYCIRKSETLD